MNNTLITFENLELNCDLVIQWNGSATFNVMTREPMDGEFITVDCFTVYGKDTQGGACTFEEAKQHAEEHLANPDGDSECWTCNHCQVTHTADMTVGCIDEHGKTCSDCWGDILAEGIAEAEKLTIPNDEHPCFKVGDKVTFMQTIERFPFTIVDVGDTGTIVGFEESHSDRATDPLVLIKMDNEHIVKDLAEWDGILYLSNTPISDISNNDYEGLDAIRLTRP